MKRGIEKLIGLGLPDVSKMVSEYYFSFVKDVELNVDGDNSTLIKADEDEQGSVTYYKEIKVKKPKVLGRRLEGGKLSTNPKRNHTLNLDLQGGYSIYLELVDIEVSHDDTTYGFSDNVTIMNRRTRKEMTIEELNNDADFNKKLKLIDLMEGWD